MSQQYPQEPGYGYPQQQQPTQWGAPHQPQPGWGAPPPQPPKKTSTGKTIGIVVAGVFGLLVIIGIFGAALSDGGSDDSSKGSTVSAEPTPTDDPAAEDPAAEVEEEPTEEPAPESPVKVTAKNTPFAKSILAADSNYTSVLVTITNNGDEPIDVNPLYFAITDSKGTKHTAELAADENQIDTVELAPGENVSGTVTGKGKFTAKYVTYTDGFLGESLRADVS